MGRQLENQATGGDSLLSLSVVPTVIVNVESERITFVNPAAAALLHREVESVSDSLLADICHPDDLMTLRQGLANHGPVPGGSRYLRTRFLVPGGGHVTVEMAVVDVPSGMLEGSLVMINLRDVTSDTSLAVFVRMLADMPDGDTIVNAMVAGPLRRLPVTTVSLSFVDQSARQVGLLGTHGVAAEDRRRYSVTPLDHSHPVGSAALTGAITWESLRSVAERFPLAAPEARRDPFFMTAESVSVPVTSRGVVVGIVFIIFSHEVERSWSLLEYLSAFSFAIAPWLVTHLSSSVERQPAKVTHFELTARERTVLDGVVRGLTNAEIARGLGYSEATVRADLLRVSKLVAANGRREVVRRARELGIYPE